MDRPWIRENFFSRPETDSSRTRRQNYLQHLLHKKVRDFVNAILHDTPVPVDGKDGLMSVYIAIAADKSLKENRPVSLTEVM
jgi:myo-inositol 2-dehydrogenase/D-chiro-inositol 1-dehydrogenase